MGLAGYLTSSAMALSALAEEVADEEQAELLAKEHARRKAAAARAQATHKAVIQMASHHAVIPQTGSACSAVCGSPRFVAAGSKTVFFLQEHLRKKQNIC